MEAACLPAGRFCGPVDDVRSAARLLHGFPLGSTHCDPRSFMHAYQDPVKVKYDLAASMSVVSALSFSVKETWSAPQSIALLGLGKRRRQRNRSRPVLSLRSIHR